MNPPVGAEPSSRSYRDTLVADRRLPKPTDGHSPYRIVLAGNANLDFTAPALRVGMAAEGMVAEIRSAAYGNWIAETFAAGHADAWIVWLSSMGSTRGLTEPMHVDVAATIAALERLLAGGVRVVVVPPEATALEDDPFSPLARRRADTVRALLDGMPPAVIVLDVDPIVRRIGVDAWSAPRYWEQAKSPCHPDAASAVGFELATVLARSMRPTVKAVAVDLDDTLWGGLVGEVGPAGLHLDPDGKGRAHLEMQRFLLDLTAQGVAVGVVSKNEVDVARRAFEERPEMILSLDSFVRFDVSWEPKYLAIRRLADQLNVGIDSICFIDDSAFERDEAAKMLPELIVPDLAAAPERRVSELVRSRLFMAPVVSEEDRLRVDFYRRDAQADHDRDGDLDAYLAGLEMHLEAMPVGDENFDRALSLLHKTNQFNLTLWRPSPQELREWAAEPGHYAMTFRLADRLGDAGIIAVVLASVDGGAGSIDGWVMSCRVFSRGVEWAVAEHLRSWLDHNGASNVVAAHAAGPRNALVGGVLAALGLVRVDGDPASGSEQFSAPSIRVPDHQVTIVDR